MVNMSAQYALDDLVSIIDDDVPNEMLKDYNNALKILRNIIRNMDDCDGD